MKRLFISKNEDKVPLLLSFCKEQQLDLAGHSFLSFEAREFKIEHDYDVLFFSSTRSFLYFSKVIEIPENIKIACAGAETAKLVESKGFEVDYYSAASGDVIGSAKEFAEWLGGRRVLFPVSQLSKKSYSMFIQPDLCEFCLCYLTSIKQQSIESCDYYAFTSPSNVRGFLMENKIPSSSKIITWGTTTADELRKNYYDVSHILSDSNEQALIDYLKTIL